jgi:hypothetical protein
MRAIGDMRLKKRGIEAHNAAAIAEGGPKIASGIIGSMQSSVARKHGVDGAM